MSKTIAIIVGVILLAALLLFSMTFTVNFHEVAIKTRFGRITSDSVIRDAGLKFRVPLFVDKVTTFDTRLQLRESRLENVQTADGQQVLARAYLLWKVDLQKDGPLNFYGSFPNGVDDAGQSIGEQFGTLLVSGLSRFRFNELIGANSRLPDAEQAIKNEMMAALRTKGIEPVSVGISQLVLPPKTSQAVLARMQATQTKLSELERSRGDSEASGIRNRATAMAGKITAFAEQRAAEIRAMGDSDAERFMKEMSKDGGEELAVFLTWLDTLQATLSQYTTFIIPTSYAPFHLMNLNSPQGPGGVPIPSEGTEQPAAAAETRDGGQPKKCLPAPHPSGAGG